MYPFCLSESNTKLLELKEKKLTKTEIQSYRKKLSNPAYMENAIKDAADKILKEII